MREIHKILTVSGIQYNQTMIVLRHQGTKAGLTSEGLHRCSYFNVLITDCAVPAVDMTNSIPEYHRGDSMVNTASNQTRMHVARLGIFNEHRSGCVLQDIYMAN